MNEEINPELKADKVKAEIKERLESSDLSEIIERIDYLIEEESNDVEPHQVGLKVAVLMADELKNGKALGEDSSKELLKWKGYFTPTELDEVVKSARQYLLEPEKLAENLAKRLFEEGED